MRHVWIAVGAMVLLVRSASADQCQCIDAEQQAAAMSRLSAGTKIVEYCEPCASEAPIATTVRTVVPRSLGSGCTTLSVNGNTTRPFDLAYTFVQLDPDVEVYTNLADLAGCPHVGTSDAIAADGTRPVPTPTGSATIAPIDGGDAGRPRVITDLAGDAKPELCRVVRETGVRTPSDYVDCQPIGGGTRTFRSSAAVDIGDPATATFADHNADGRLDFCRIVDGAPVCELGAATGFTRRLAGPRATPPSAPMRGFADVDGDKRADDCRIVDGTTSARLVCTLALATGGFGTTTVSAPLGAGIGDASWPRWMADIDADGRADFCRVLAGELACTVLGATTPPISLGRAPLGFDGAVDAMTADVNGDRAVDLCAVSRTAVPICVLGGATARGGTVMLAPMADVSRYAWGDVNRDGAADVCLADGRGRAATCSTGGFSAWKPGEPDNTGHCARLLLASGLWADADCRLEHRFVCGHISNPTRWQLTQASGDWDAGHRACIAELGEGWRFSAPDSIDESEAMLAVLRQHTTGGDAWLNATDRVDEGTWVRDDLFRAWAGREPADQLGARSCAVSGSAGWRADTCATRRRFACRSVDEPYTWRISSRSERWTRGFRVCTGDLGAGYRFAAPRTPEDHAAIRAAAGSSDVWIDLTLFSDGYWDEIDPIYDNFLGAEPDQQQGSERCVTIARGGGWADSGCDLSNPVACRRDDAASPWFLGGAGSWRSASETCRAAGGWFDAPSNDAENAALAALVTVPTWINRAGDGTGDTDRLDKRCLWDGCFFEAVVALTAIVAVATVAEAYYLHSQPTDYTAAAPSVPTCPDYGTADAGEPVELLVVVTSAAKKEMLAAGRDPDTVVRERVQAFNDALRDSQIARRLDLLAIEYTDWNMSAYANDAGALLRAANGTSATVTPDDDAKRIRNLRKRYNADLVSIVVPGGLRSAGGAVCGIGDDTIGSPGELRPGFSILKWDCGPISQRSGFVHELGHNFGLHHDRYTVAKDRPGTSADALPGYAYGFVNVARTFYTIMAYPTKFLDTGVRTNRLLVRFSSPCLRDPVSNLAIGDAANDDRRALLENWGAVSRYRPKPIRDL